MKNQNEAQQRRDARIGFRAIGLAILLLIFLQLLTCKPSIAQSNYKAVSKGFAVDSTKAIKDGNNKFKGHQVYLSSKKSTPFYVVIDKNGNEHAVYLKKD